MGMIRTAALLALLAGTAVATVDVRPSAAITLMDLIRGGKKRVVAEEPASLPGVDAGVAYPEAQPAKPKVAAKPLPRVTGPQYYTYKAPALRAVDTGKLVDPVYTGSLDASAAAHAAENPIRPYLADVKVMAEGDVAAALEAFYAGHPDFLWVDETGPNDRARAVIAVLAAADTVGLDAADYAVALPETALDPLDATARQKELARFELALSAAALTYMRDTVRGRIDPNRISGYHDFVRKPVDLARVVTVLAASHAPAAYIASRTPSGPEFAALKAELQRLRAENGADTVIRIAPGTVLKPGESNAELANIVAAIRARGSDALKAAHAATLAAYAATPDYTPDLVALVEAFQAEHGLKPDGIVGRASIRVLTGGDTSASKIDKVRIAMEQARWLPADLGSRYVFINQPAFMAYYHEDDREQFSMRVVVGSKSNQTYFFEDEIQTVEFNPYWGVPQSIIINEMLPKLRNDPSYLDRMGYQVELGGRPVSSSAVNWHGSTSGVAVRQPPSSDNALGELKILFPNAHAIYMHDTPSKSFFKKDMRALSHGCVRLAEPRKMAAAVLGISVDDVAKEIAGGRNKARQLSQKIPVYVSYFTAWPDKDGRVEYFDDVYERDGYMQRAIEATRAARSARS
ncbi:L,D-transpeptidase family protein [Ensifer soli]|uniref:L,D-transpeptidase family protein n=1 Tax=Ciceribacter sp. sgz301302 TaxID=3342379 RepID=UPI0035B72D00